jgi:glycosyltransferase involved in cell wall biosynthesis
MPLVTIITICRNAAAHIESTMISVLQQTYSDIEYFIVDGNSSDDTASKALELATRFPDRRVRIISECDEGIADAMNKGVRLSSGEIITHLHAGDRYVEKTIIAQMVESYREARWRWAVAGSVVVDKFGRTGHLYRANPDCRILLKKNCIPHQSTFLVRDIFDRHGFFRVDLRQAMDYEFWLRLVFKGGEHYQVLPFITTYFLEGGRSARIRELLRYLVMLRRELHSYVDKLTWMDDIVFLGRVVAFAAYTGLRTRLTRITFFVSRGTRRYS